MAIFRISPSLALMILVGLIFVLTLYLIVSLHPQIRELKRKLSLSEFQGTAHQQTIQFTFNRLHRRSVWMHLLILILGFLSLGFIPRFLQ